MTSTVLPDSSTLSLRYSQFFTACHSLHASLESVGDQCALLDRVLHASLSSVHLPLQQRRLREAVHELLVFADYREELQRRKEQHLRLYGAGAGSGDGGVAAAARPAALPSGMTGFCPPAPSHTADCPFTTWRACRSKGEANQARRGRSSSDVPTARLVSSTQEDQDTEDAEVHNQPWVLPCGAVESSSTAPDVATRDDNLGFTVLSTCTPEAVRHCPLCTAHLLLQLCWWSVVLLQRVGVAAQADGSAAPFSLPHSVLPLSTKEATVHLMSIAQRLLQIGWHLSLTVTTEKVEVKSATSEQDDPVDAENHEEDQRLPDSAVDFDAQTQMTAARLASGCLGLSAALLASVPLLVPLRIPAPPAALMRITRQSPGSNVQATSGVPSPTELPRVAVAVVSLDDVVRVVRAGLMEACLTGLTLIDGGRSSIQVLVRTVTDLTWWENHAVRSGVARGSSPSSAPGVLCEKDAAPASPQPSSPGEAMLHYALSWPPPSPEAAMGSHSAELDELKQVAVLLWVFMEFVDECDSVDRVGRHCSRSSSPVGHSAAAAAADHGGTEVRTAPPAFLTEREERRCRLARTAELLDSQVKPRLLSLRDAADGACSTRGRQLLSLWWLLRAELVRYLHPGQGSVRSELQEAAREAIKCCDAAREFAGATVAHPDTQLWCLEGEAGDPARGRSGDSEVHNAPRSWRLCVPAGTAASPWMTMPSCSDVQPVAGAFPQTEGKFARIGVAPVVWLRLWLVLGTSVFRGTALTDILAARSAAAAAAAAREEESEGKEVGRAERHEPSPPAVSQARSQKQLSPSLTPGSTQGRRTVSPASAVPADVLGGSARRTSNKSKVGDAVPVRAHVVPRPRRGHMAKPASPSPPSSSLPPASRRMLSEQRRTRSSPSRSEEEMKARASAHTKDVIARGLHSLHFGMEHGSFWWRWKTLLTVPSTSPLNQAESSFLQRCIATSTARLYHGLGARTAEADYHRGRRESRQDKRGARLPCSYTTLSPSGSPLLHRGSRCLPRAFFALQPLMENSAKAYTTAMQALYHDHDACENSSRGDSLSSSSSHESPAAADPNAARVAGCEVTSDDERGVGGQASPEVSSAITVVDSGRSTGVVGECFPATSVVAACDADVRRVVQAYAAQVAATVANRAAEVTSPPDDQNTIKESVPSPLLVSGGIRFGGARFTATDMATSDHPSKPTLDQPARSSLSTSIHTAPTLSTAATTVLRNECIRESHNGGQKERLPGVSETKMASSSPSVVAPLSAEGATLPVSWAVFTERDSNALNRDETCTSASSHELKATLRSTVQVRDLTSVPQRSPTWAVKEAEKVTVVRPCQEAATSSMEEATRAIARLRRRPIVTAGKVTSSAAGEPTSLPSASIHPL